MFIETIDQHGRQKVYLRADRVSGFKVWPVPHSNETHTEVFLTGNAESLMLGESAEALMQRLGRALGIHQ